MSGSFHSLPATKLTDAVENLLLPKLATALRGRERGHCMRVSDLGADLTVPLAKGLRHQVPAANIYVLAEGAVAPDDDLYVSSTKLVELRNPLPDGSLRPPLCVFLPPNLQTSAEDSFGVATFEEFDQGDAYESLRLQVMKRIPSSVQGYVRDFLQHVREQRWRWASGAAQVRYLLCAEANGNDGEAFGGALYELGLVPDFKLFDDPATAYGRVCKNLDCVRHLTDADSSVLGRVLDLDLVNQGLRRRLAEYLAETSLEDPVAWTRDIVLDRRNWDLSFDKWAFGAEIAPDRIRFLRVETDLPSVSEDESIDIRLADLIGQQVLSLKDRRRLSVVLEVDPHPRQVQGLSYFTVQIIAEESGPVGAFRKIKVWKQARTHVTVSLLRLNRIDFEEGWHHVRVLPRTADGDPIPIDDLADRAAKRSNESEPFYVMPGADLEEEPSQRSVPKSASVEHARIDRQFGAVLQQRDPAEVALARVGWKQHNGPRRVTVQEILEAGFGKDGTFQIAVSRWLKDIEQRILESPERPVSWRMEIHMGAPQTPTTDVGEWPASPALRSFLDARASYFDCVAQGTLALVSQGLDFLASERAVLAYASAYNDLIEDLAGRVEQEAGSSQRKAVMALRSALTVDSVRLAVRDYRGHIREAALVAPTHPLRALWRLGWAQLGAAWVGNAGKGLQEQVTPAREALLGGISSINFPPMLPTSDGRIFSSVDHIDAFWPLYAPAAEVDARGLLGEVCAAFGLQEASIGGAAITGEVLASRMERYLVQHPYVRTLAVNAFNPGRAAVLADALVALQQREAFRDLRYDVRLFVPDANAAGVGEAVGVLLSADGVATGEAFTIPTRSHLFPKLSLGVLSTGDFRSNPVRYRAHVSFLFDVFATEEVAAGQPIRPEGTVPMYGLVQDFAIQYDDDESGVRWQRQPRHGTPTAIKGAGETSRLLEKLPASISAATATVARAMPDRAARPIIRLVLGADRRALISEVHDASDWVFTVDRNMGIEFFDHGGRRQRPDYLIDYTPSAAPEHGHRLVISSRSLAELKAILGPVLTEYGMQADEHQVAAILGHLRSLSGRLALKLVSSPTARAEALGLALARMFLEYQGALRNQIVVPLDAHVELFRTAKSQAETIGDEVTVRRTDLALFDLDLANRKITCNLVEVKCYAQRLGLGGFRQLQKQMIEQLGQSEQVLQTHFGPQPAVSDRPDRLLKTRELSTLVEFYLDRALRYGLIESTAGEEARTFLDFLEGGYSLRFTQCGLVFDFEKAGTEPAEEEAGVEFHRVGIDMIRRLVEHVASASGGVESNDGGEDAGATWATPVGTELPVPRIESAAFLVADRARVTTVPDLGVATDDQREAVDDHRLSERDVEVGQGPPSRDSVRPVALPEESGDKSGPVCDAILGATEFSPQYGVIGRASGRQVGLDLNETHTISLFGVQGGGKSYTLGSVVEMACMAVEGVNRLPHPLAGVIFHYSATLDYQPEFTAMAAPNAVDAEVRALRTGYGATPRALEDLLILTPAAKVEERRAEYPGIEVLPIAFAASELKTSHWKFLMGAVGSQSMYIRQLALIMKKLRGALTLDALRQGVQDSGLSDYLKDLALLRLSFAKDYVDDTCRLTDVLRPGRLVIVDLRDEFIEKDEALGLFVVLLQLFAETTYHGRRFNKLVVFDEAHKYIDSPDLVAGLVEVVREMRHKGTTIMVASQDPPSVPISLIELSTQIVLHKFNSPAWLKHVQKANVALDALTPSKLAALGPGEAYAWSSRATDDAFTRGAVKIRCRPRVTRHGGATKTAVVRSDE